MLGEKVAKKLRGSLLNGVYAVVNLPDDERARAGRNRALAAEHGLGATHPDEEMDIIRRALDQIREDVAPYGVEIPAVPEVDRRRRRCTEATGAAHELQTQHRLRRRCCWPRPRWRRPRRRRHWPAKPVSLVVPYPPGGSADILARASARSWASAWASRWWSRTRPAPARPSARKAVAAPAADGYTLLMGTVSSQAINPAMNKVGYDPLKDFIAVAPRRVHSRSCWSPTPAWPPATSAT